MRRRELFGLAAALAAPGISRAEAPAGEPIIVGVSGPLTGQYAQYGADWRRGFDLAIEAANAGGGIAGRPLRYQFEDSQADPRQAVAIAQKFVQDPRIVIELGDFSSAASMAASPIYQRGRLVQFGFTNSHPDFTKGGDYMWSNAPNQADEMPMMADYVVSSLGLKRLAVLFINSDWGRTSKDLFAKAAAVRGAQILDTEGYLPDERDYRSTLVRVRDTKPDGLVLISYYPDGALIVQQVRAEQLTQPIVAANSVYSPKFLELGGKAVDGVYTMTNFFPGDPRPVVQDFVKRYAAAYGTPPGSYNARAYDAMIVVIELLRQFGVDRQAVHDGLAKIKDVPSVVYGSVTFDPVSRRVLHPTNINLQVRDGAFTIWDGKAAI